MVSVSLWSFCGNLFAQTEGYYYNLNGFYIGSIGESPSVIFLSSNEDFANIVANREGFAMPLGEASDIFTMLAAVFSETFPDADYYERVGIAFAIRNNNTARNADTYMRAMYGYESIRQTTLRIAHVTQNGNPRYSELWQSAPTITDPDMAKTMKAVLFVLANFELDPTKDAVFWEGINSLRLQYRLHLRKMATGYEVHPEHNLDTEIESYFYMETTPIGGIVFFRFETTAAIGKTVFSRVHPEFVRVFAAPRY